MSHGSFLSHQEEKFKKNFPILELAVLVRCPNLSEYKAIYPQFAEEMDDEEWKIVKAQLKYDPVTSHDVVIFLSFNARLLQDKQAAGNILNNVFYNLLAQQANCFSI